MPYAQRFGIVLALVVELGREVLGRATKLQILFTIFAKGLGGATEINEPNLKIVKMLYIEPSSYGTTYVTIQIKHFLKDTGVIK